MTQRILLSLAIAVAVGGGAIASTGAFFSDTETSTGNTFTAGAIDLTVDNVQHYNNAICTNGTWQLENGAATSTDQYPILGSKCDGTWSPTNLGAETHFFNFGDVKPGDQGEDTVSLHIDNNPAWACMNIKTTANDENTLIAPEAVAGDTSTTTGELASNIHFQTWLDQGVDGVGTGDNIWEQGEPALSSGTLNDLVGNGTTLTLADGGTGTPLPPSATDYIGVFWCAGTITGGAGNLGCDGSTMDNKSQTDSATADVSFSVVQSRNNPNFLCNPPAPQG